MHKKRKRENMNTRGLVVAAIFFILMWVLSSRKPRPRTDANWPRQKHIVNHDVYWELPAKPIGVLIFAHGCNHRGSDPWPVSESCPQCLGLPGEWTIRNTALRRRLAFLSISSIQATRDSVGCWIPRASAPGEDDLSSVAAIFEAIVKEERQLKGLPVYALGASSGGGFVAMLPKVMKLDGMVAQIMGVPADRLSADRSGAGSGTALTAFPPSVFMHMPRDPRVAELVSQDIAALKAGNVAVAEVKVEPRAVTPGFLTLQSGGVIDRGMATKIVDALKKGGFIDDAGVIKEDPRRSRGWIDAVSGAVNRAINLKPDESPLTQLMNVAYAQHEIVASGVDAALEWLEGGGKGDLAALLEKEMAEEARAEGGASR